MILTMKYSPETEEETFSVKVEALELFPTDVCYKSPAVSALFKGLMMRKASISDGYSERKASMKFQGSGKSGLSEEDGSAADSMMMNIDNLIKVAANNEEEEEEKVAKDLANANSKKIIHSNGD